MNPPTEPVTVGQGTTTERQTYQFFDFAPFSGVNYYRLRQVDFDGATEYHPIISVVFEGKARLSLEAYPNPVQDQLHVRWQAGAARDVRLRLVDLRGVIWREQILPAGSGLENLPVTNLAAGIYFLQLLQGGKIETIRFIKE